MSAALATPAPVLDRPGGLTLESRLDAVIAGARAGAQADCPVCGATMAPDHEGGELRCGGCNTRLS
jgi:hypothetical protein